MAAHCMSTERQQEWIGNVVGILSFLAMAFVYVNVLACLYITIGGGHLPQWWTNFLNK